MAKHRRHKEVPTEPLAEENSVAEAVESAESVAPFPRVPCPDCTVLVADGGKSEFGAKGGPKAGLINEHTHCPACNGSGLV